ncbi:hypothetical protein EZL74_01720 [Flavobacterium silvisoli]|uniref:DUF1129 family protein n=1 Tax=Flavobacterium silvisoli TaxID=2529433 RepID=A0A4Q9Z508_9FLAO|nr:hypothetical protein [Flavobacterium silvisoli]TBX71250.1 hypothetical protein EZL74_01720 [Flavobacterium silvisoli]
MNLSKDEIRFIDTYLLSNDVVYTDIRQEMVDHIATAVEEKMSTGQNEFYPAFKEYMILNKKAILKNNKKQWSFSWEVVRQFLLFLFKPSMLFFGILLFFFFKKVDVNPYFSESFTVNNLFFVLVITLALFQTGYVRWYLKKRFYAVEKAGNILMILYQLQLFFLPIFGKENVSVYTLTLFTFLFTGYGVYFLKEIIKFNRHRLNYI